MAMTAIDRLDDLQHSFFQDYLDQDFQLSTAIDADVPPVLSVQLAQVEPHRTEPDGQQRHSFSLIFRGAMTALLSQQIYRLSHDTLGCMDIFLVPIGPDDKGMLYEAMFN